MQQWHVEQGDVTEVLRTLRDCVFDAVLCDPPYGMKFRGHRWDYEVPSVDVWREVLRVCKPGAPLLAFGGPRTFHRVAVNIEDAGWEIGDSLAWLFGQGKPSSKRRLKPGHEPIVCATRPGAPGMFDPTAIEACRVTGARWPANVALDEDSARALDEQSGMLHTHRGNVKKHHASIGYGGGGQGSERVIVDDKGGASRFFYCTKVKGAEAEGNTHPTKKPVALTEWLARLCLPAEGGTLLVPFAGSGSEMLGAFRAGWPAIVGIEQQAEYVSIAQRRLSAA